MSLRHGLILPRFRVSWKKSPGGLRHGFSPAAPCIMKRSPGSLCHGFILPRLLLETHGFLNGLRLDEQRKITLKKALYSMVTGSIRERPAWPLGPWLFLGPQPGSAGGRIDDRGTFVLSRVVYNRPQEKS